MTVKSTYVVNDSRFGGVAIAASGAMRAIRHLDKFVFVDGRSVQNMREGTTRCVRFIDDNFVGNIAWSESFVKLNEDGAQVADEVEDDQWVVRKGEVVLITTDDPRNKNVRWREHTLRKVTYFKGSELVKKPGRDNERYWTFKRGEWFCSVRREQFFSTPDDATGD